MTVFDYRILRTRNSWLFCRRYQCFLQEIILPIRENVHIFIIGIRQVGSVKYHVLSTKSGGKRQNSGSVN